MRLIWSKAALDDLLRIDDYLTGHDPRAAIAALRAIDAKAKLLKQFPALGPPVDSRARYASVGRTPHVLVYAIHPDHIRIGRVYDSRQDWQRGTDDT